MSFLQHLFTILILFFIQPVFVLAQVITWSDESIGYAKNYGFGVLGENEAGIYALQASGRNYKKFDIQHFTHNLRLKNQKTINTGKYDFQGAGILADKPYYLLNKNNSREATNHIIGTRLGAGLNEIETKELMNFEPVGSSVKQEIFIKETHNLNGLGILCTQEIFGNTDEFHVYYGFFDAELNKVHHKKLKLNFDIDYIKIQDFHFDEYGNFYLAIFLENKQLKTGFGRQQSILVYYQANSEKLTQISLTDKGTIAQQINITYDFVNKSVIFYGLYGPEGNAYHLGVFRVGINAENGTVVQNFFTMFSAEFISKVIGSKRQEKGELLNYFELRGVTLTMNGDLIIIMERYFTALETESYFHNNIPYSTTRKVHHFDEILIVSINTSGEFVWEKHLNKLQTALGDNIYFCSVAISTLPNQINIFYNETSGITSDMVRVTIDKNGEIIKKPLTSRTDYDASMIPSLSRQIGYNRILLRIAKGNSINLAKISLPVD